MKDFNEKEKLELQNILKTFRHNTELLTFEEVSCDKNLCTKILKQNAKMKDIVSACDSLGDLTDKSRDEQVQKIQNLLQKFNGELDNIVVELVADDKKFFLFDALVEHFKALCKKNNFSFFTTQNDKGVTFNISGFGALDCFSAECGRHRGTRNNFSQDILVFVYKTPEEQPFSFGENDVKVEFFHSSGRGGQNINKVATAVRLTHLQSNIVSVCQQERTQLQNRNLAMERLKQKVKNYYQKSANDAIKHSKTEQMKAMKTVLKNYNYDDIGTLFSGDKNE
jgi:peptide chain release factor 1